jgi:hypothetical protein
VPAILLMGSPSTSSRSARVRQRGWITERIHDSDTFCRSPRQSACYEGQCELVMLARLCTWVVADDAARLYPDLVDCQRGRRSPVMRSLTSRRAS